jgi:hypothetical protein
MFCAQSNLHSGVTESVSTYNASGRRAQIEAPHCAGNRERFFRAQIPLTSNTSAKTMIK